MNLFSKALIASSVIIPTLTAHLTHAGESPRAPKKSAKNEVELLYYQHAKQGRISINENKNGCYNITLLGLTPTVIYFSNFPFHQSGRISLTKYNTSWQHAKEIDGIQPNAVLHAYNNKNYTDQSAINMTVTLIDLKYNEASKSMSYVACPIDQKEKLALATPMLASSIYEVDLFIDPFHPWPP